MSDTVLKLIPADPHWTPGQSAIAEARALLMAFAPQTAELTSEVRESVEFIDPGEHFERVACPHCRKPLDTEWWQAAMDEAFESHFEDLQVETPCCRRAASLNDLTYEWPAGFAKFSLEARDPMREELSLEELRRLEKALGCRLRQIWAHY